MKPPKNILIPLDFSARVPGNWDTIAKCTLNAQHRDGEYLMHFSDDVTKEHEDASHNLDRTWGGSVWGTIGIDGRVTPTHLEIGGEVYPIGAKLDKDSRLDFLEKVRGSYHRAKIFFGKYLEKWLAKYPEDRR